MKAWLDTSHPIVSWDFEICSTHRVIYFWFWFFFSPNTKWAARIFEKVQVKKLVKSNKSISCKKHFDKNSFFAILKMAKNQFLTGKKFKTAKNAISRNWFIWFHEFFCLWNQNLKTASTGSRITPIKYFAFPL